MCRNQAPTPPRFTWRESARLARTAAALSILALGASCAVLDEELDRDERRPVVGDGGRVVGISGNYAYRDDDLQEREAFALRLTFDEHLTDEHVVGGYALGQFSNQEDDRDGREQIWAGVQYRYFHHLNSRTAIFGGPTIGVTYFDDELTNDGSFTYGVSGGIRHWLTDRAALTIEPVWLRANFNDASGGDSEEFLVLWGLAYSL